MRQGIDASPARSAALTSWASDAFEHDDRRRDTRVVRDRNQSRDHPEARGMWRGVSDEGEHGSPRASSDFDVVPEDVGRAAEGFRRRFLRRETTAERRRAVGAPTQIAAYAGSQDPLPEAIA